MKKVLTIAVIALSLALPSTALAGVSIQTPAGYLPAQAATVIPTGVTYAADGTESTQLGMPVSTDGGTRYMLRVQGDLPSDTADLGGKLMLTTADRLANDDAPLASVNLPPLTRNLWPGQYALTCPHHGCGGYDTAEAASWGSGLLLVEQSCSSTFGCEDIMLPSVGVAAFTPAASVVGDPWFRFQSDYRANTHLIVTRKDGTVTKRVSLGWLASGKHSIHFSCAKGKTRYVHVRGVAADGAVQVSPTRQAHC